MNKKKWAIRIFLVVFSVCFVLAVAAAWRFRRHPERQIVKFPAKVSPKQATTYIFESAPFFFPFKTRGASTSTLKPFSQDFSAFGRQNSYGFRTPEYTIAHPPDTFRIVVLGDAATWGTGVTMEEAFPYVLSERLNFNCSRARFEVISLGVTGSKLKDNFIKLLAHGQSLNPDLVIIQIGTDDLDFYNYFTFYVIHGMKNASAAYVEKEKEVFKKDSLDRKVMSDVLSELHKWSNQKSTPVCFLVFPPIDTNISGNNFGNYNPAKMVGYFSSFQEVVQEIRDSGFATLDLVDSFRKAASGQYLATSPSNGNPNTLAHAIAADSLYSFLIEKKLSGCSELRLKPGGKNWKDEEALQREATQRWSELSVSYQQQVSYFLRLLQIEPNDPWITSELASVYFGSRRFKDSFDTYKTLSQIAPDYAAPWYHMALTTGYRRKRIELLEEMLQRVPDHTIAMQFLARLYEDEKRMNDACRLLKTILEIPSYQEQYELTQEQFKKDNCIQILSSAGPASIN